MLLIIGGFFIQLIFLVSVFDIHFQSPIVKGMTPYSSEIAAPAKRLVLISADGLRFDTFLSHGNDRQPNAPFLRLVLLIIRIVVQNQVWNFSFDFAGQSLPPAENGGCLTQEYPRNQDQVMLQ